MVELNLEHYQFEYAIAVEGPKKKKQKQKREDEVLIVEQSHLEHLDTKFKYVSEKLKAFALWVMSVPVAGSDNPPMIICSVACSGLEGRLV